MQRNKIWKSKHISSELNVSNENHNKSLGQGNEKVIVVLEDFVF